MPVFAALFAGRDLLRHEIHAARGDLRSAIYIEFKPALACRLPSTIAGSDYPRRFALDAIFLGEFGQKPVVARLAGCLRRCCAPPFEDSFNFFLEVGFLIPGRRLAGKKTLSVPEPDLRQPGAKSIRTGDKAIARVRRDDHDIAGREDKRCVILNRFTAAADDVSYNRRNHSVRVGLFVSREVDEAAGEGAERCDGIATEYAHIPKSEFTGRKHGWLDDPREDRDALVLAPLLDEASFVIVIVRLVVRLSHSRLKIRGRLRAARCRRGRGRRRHSASTTRTALAVPRRH